MKPVTPEEAQNKPIPDFVIEIVNQLVTENYRDNSASFTLKEFIKRVKDVGKEYESWWADFEPLYREIGWKVVYEKPCYYDGESFDSYYQFVKKGK